MTRQCDSCVPEGSHSSVGREEALRPPRERVQQRVLPGGDLGQTPKLQLVKGTEDVLDRQMPWTKSRSGGYLWGEARLQCGLQGGRQGVTHGRMHNAETDCQEDIPCTQRTGRALRSS